MTSIKDHFDVNAVVLDEPATLRIGQAVRVIVEPATLINDDDWDESTALYIHPLDAVPSDFERRPGSAAGQIKMTDAFNATQDEFEEYL